MADEILTPPATTAPSPNAAPREQSLSKPQAPASSIPKLANFDMKDDHDIASSIDESPPPSSTPSKPAEGGQATGTEGSLIPPTETKEGVSGQEGASPTAARTTEEKGQDGSDVIKVSKPAGQFDFTGYSPEEVTLLKQMSNTARDHVGGLMKKAKDMEKMAKDASFLQHPQAFQLDPAYRDMQTDQFFVTREAEYWKGQLDLIKAGDNWRPVVRWNDDGTPVLGVERPPTGQDEEQVRLAMNECYQKAGENNNKIKQFAQTQQQRFAKDLNDINQERARRFEWVADPKLLEHKLEVPGVGVKTIRDIRNDFVNMFPSYHRATAGVEVASDLFVAVQVLAARLRAAEGKTQIAETRADEIRRVEPSSSTRPANGSAGSGKAFGGVKTFSMEGVTGL